MAQDWERLGLVGRLWAPDGSRRGRSRALDACSGRGQASPEDCPGLTLRCPCVSRAGGTMRTAGRAALLAALLLLAQLRPGAASGVGRRRRRRPPRFEIRVCAGAQDSGPRRQGPPLSLLLLAGPSRAAGQAGSRWGSRTAGERPRRD